MLRALHPHLCENDPITLSREESLHLVRVRRATVGTVVELLDGNGQRARARIIEARPRAARLEIIELEQCPPPSCALTLWQAIPKARGMESIIQKATELGATAIQPLFTAHGDVRLTGERLESKEARWQSAANEAIKQCGNPWSPALRPAMTLTEVVNEADTPAALKLVAALVDPAVAVHELVETHLENPPPEIQIHLAVGPEGDFSAMEYELLASHGWQAVSLGPLVLRVETATCALLALTLDSVRRTLRT